VAGNLLHSQVSEDKLIRLMFGKELENPFVKRTRKTGKAMEPVLELKEIESRADGVSIALKGIDLEIRPGEIVGVAGVSGNGQKELGDLILGMSQPFHGSKFLFGEEATRWSIRKVRRGGVAFIPESPLEMAVTGWLPIIHNLALTRPWRYTRSAGFRVNWQKVAADARVSFGQLGFDIPNLYSPAGSLSGGNLQRMTIARELVEEPRLIIASYLTRGLDVQSTLAAQKALMDARDRGCAILLVSEDLEELIQLSDRLIVMLDGRIVSTLKPGQTSPIEIGHLMTGSKAKHASKH
jgi:simple sugar transport system ATP-binding protein